MGSDATVAGRLSAAIALVGDVLVGWLLLAATYYVVVMAVPPAGVRFFVAVPALLVLPGYVLTAALFPRANRPGVAVHSRTQAGTVSVRERLALSFGLSVALVVLFTFVIGMASGAITPAAVLGTLAGFVGVVGLVAILRRLSVPPADRFALPVGSWLAEYRRALSARSLGGQLVVALLVVSIVAALSTAVYAVAVPQHGGTFTDFYLATENDSVEHVAAGYPTNVTENQSASLTFGVENFERERQEYVVVVTLDRVVGEGDDRRRVERRELGRFRRTVDDGVRWIEPHRIKPSMTGEDLQLNYYLYRDDAPETPTRDSAYRHLHTWLDVQPALANESGGTDGGTGGEAAGGTDSEQADEPAGNASQGAEQF